MFLHLSVSHSVHRGGVPGQVHPHPPWAGTPPRQVHPPEAVHAGRYGQQAGGTHPTGMHSCFHFVVAAVPVANCGEPSNGKYYLVCNSFIIPQSKEKFCSLPVQFTPHPYISI